MHPFAILLTLLLAQAPAGVQQPPVPPPIISSTLSVKQVVLAGQTPLTVSSVPHGIEGTCVNGCTMPLGMSGQSVTLTATGGRVRWGGACDKYITIRCTVSTRSSVAVTLSPMTANVLSVTQLPVPALASARVVSEPAGIEGLCITACRHEFPYGTTVKLRLAAAAPYVWSAGCSAATVDSCTTAMTDERTISFSRREKATARLTIEMPVRYALVNMDPGPDGPRFRCTAPCNPIYPAGVHVVISDYDGSGWTDDCKDAAVHSCEVVMSRDRKVGLIFNPPQPAPAGDVTLTAVAVGAGAEFTFRPEGQTKRCAGCTRDYKASTNVQVVVKPALLTDFDKWEGCDSVSGMACEVTVAKNRTVRALLSGRAR